MLSQCYQSAEAGSEVEWTKHGTEYDVTQMYGKREGEIDEGGCGRAGREDSGTAKDGDRMMRNAR
jgi:hypothetical protein